MKLQSSKLITCMLGKGRAMPVLKLLKQEHNIISANINHARGSGRFTPLASRGMGEQTEKEILSVVASELQADEVFAFIYEKGEIDQPHGGIIFQSALTGATEYQIPEALPEEA
jgi:hypothetical protein